MAGQLSQLAEVLHAQKCSCVISTDGRLTLCHGRGVMDLYQILCNTPQLLRGALIADKVVGKGAAALMIAGGVSQIYADVISRPALELLGAAGVAAEYAACVPNIINRAGTGICPVEALCRDASTARECLPLIRDFINSNNTKVKNNPV